MNLNIIRENISCGMIGSIAVVTGEGTYIDFMDTAINSNQWKIGTYLHFYHNPTFFMLVVFY